MISVEKITTRADFDRLQPVWNGLLQASRADTITLTWEWLSTWWDVFNEDRELYVLVAREGGEVIGIAPLLRRTVSHYGLLPFVRFEFLASGEDEADEICSDYLDFIIRKGREAEVMRAFCDFLNARRDEWDEILLTDMAESSVNLQIARQLCEASGIKWTPVRHQTSIYVTLEGGFDAFMKRVSTRLRKKFNKDERQAPALGAEFRVIDRVEELDEAFAILIDLHQKRWTARGEPGVFSSAKFTRFHRELSSKLAALGRVKLYILTVKGRPIVALYDFIYNGKIFYYQSGLDTTNVGLISPGVYARALGIRHAIEIGVKECDFLKGDPEGYKASWRGETRGIVQVRLAHPQSKEAIYLTTTRLIDGLRSIKRSISARVSMIGLAASFLLRGLS